MANLQRTLEDQPALVQAYKDREYTGAELAKILGYTESYVLSTLSRMGVKRDEDPDSIYRQRIYAAKRRRARIEFRKFHANKVKKGEMTVQEACEITNCSERTIYRYMKKL